MNDEELETVEKATVTLAAHTDSPWRRPFWYLLIAMCLSLTAQSVGSYFIWDVAHDTNEIVDDIDKRNSPESQAAQAKLLDEVINRVDCNSRAAIEDALNDISESNPGLTFSVDIVEEKCAAVPKGSG